MTQDDLAIDSSKLTDEDKLQCSQIVHAYLEGRLKDPVMAGKYEELHIFVAEYCDVLRSCRYHESGQVSRMPQTSAKSSQRVATTQA